jgi:hypothetical protein
MERIVFAKPHIYDGKEYPEIELDLEALTGQDLISASNQTRALGDNSPVPELSKTYLALVAAKAGKVPVDLILSLPAKDFTTVTMTVQNFLLG